MYKYYNPNLKHKNAGDCVIRAISKVLNSDWLTTYINICIQGAKDYDMPSSNSVWCRYLLDNNFTKKVINDVITVEQFTNLYPKGTYVVCTGSHVVAVEISDDEGIYYDSWDSGDEVIVYYYEKE